MSVTLTGIQFIGTQRSGSNLLRVMLEQNPDIAAPHPPHLLYKFVPLLPLYAPLDQQNYTLLVGDMIDYTYANPVPWEGVVLDKETIVNQSPQYHIFEAFRLIYEAAARYKTARYWCCKSMQNLYYSEDIERFGLDLKYIFLYRDGRDVALSFKKAIVGDKHVYPLALQWKKEQDICLHLYKRYGAEKVFLLNYEHLITSPEVCLQQLCTFLDLKYNEKMMKFYESDSSKATAAAGEMWKNVEKPLIKDNTNKFLSELSAEEIEIFEWVAGDTLQALGYSLYSDLQHPGLVQAETIVHYMKENEDRKKEFLTQASQKDIEKRQSQLKIIEKIKQRNRQV